MSIETNWCFACRHHKKEIPDEQKEVYNSLTKEYKYVIYCEKQMCLVVANDNMWIDKTTECQFFER